MKFGNRGAEMRLGRVAERDDQRMPLEDRLDNPSLHARPTTVNQTHLPEAGFGSGTHVLVHNRGNVSRQKRVEIDRIFDRDAVDHGEQLTTTIGELVNW